MSWLHDLLLLRKVCYNIIKNKKNITIFQKMVIPVYPKVLKLLIRQGPCNCEDTIFTSATTRG